jgi:hypothetical protein
MVKDVYLVKDLTTLLLYGIVSPNGERLIYGETL